MGLQSTQDIRLPESGLVALISAKPAIQIKKPLKMTCDHQSVSVGNANATVYISFKMYGLLNTH